MNETCLNQLILSDLKCGYDEPGWPATHSHHLYKQLMPGKQNTGFVLRRAPMPSSVNP